MVADSGFPATLRVMRKRLSVSASRSAGLLAVTVAWALFLTLTGSAEAVLFTIPLFLIAAPLAIGRYVGEDAIAALRACPSRQAATRPALRLDALTDFLRDRIDFAPIFGRGPPAITS